MIKVCASKPQKPFVYLVAKHGPCLQLYLLQLVFPQPEIKTCLMLQEEREELAAPAEPRDPGLSYQCNDSVVRGGYAHTLPSWEKKGRGVLSTFLV